MPTLDSQQLVMLQNQPIMECSRCGRPVRPNYCRQCDCFFDAGHIAPECYPDGVLHDSHRTY